MSDLPRILLLFGPTASGKTSAAVQLAQRLGGEVVNADSMQVYAGLPILSAMPTQAERENVPHHLFGHLPPTANWSVGEWAKAAMASVHDIHGRGKTAILAGGTGLYFEALIKGLAVMPEIPQARREALQAEAQTHGLSALYDRLRAVDPGAAGRVDANDTQRIVRALSVVDETGIPLSQWQGETVPLLHKGTWMGICLLPERAQLYARINARFDRMMRDGALDELRNFTDEYGPDGLALHKAVGVPPLLSLLHGEMHMDEAVELAKRDSRRYAKRQMTWGRNRMSDWSIHADTTALLQDFGSGIAS